MRTRKSSKVEGAAAPSRVPLIQLAAGFVFLAALVSQARVQGFSAAQIVEQARDSKKFFVTRELLPERGEIISGDGQVLAQEERTRVLVVDFRDIPRSRGFFVALASATGISATEFAQFANSSKVIEWSRPFSPSQANEIQRLKAHWRANGLGVRSSGGRRYPLGESSAGLVGFMANREPAGGFELTQDAHLRGTVGKMEGMVDRQGAFLPTRTAIGVEKSDGKTIQLTLNAEIQRQAYAAVRDAVVSNRADQGVAIVIRPRSGDLLAMASYPSFDPNQPLPATKRGGRAPEYTASYQAALEPGSTFKILTLAKAIDDRKLGLNEATQCPGSITIAGRTIRCDHHNGTRAHGTIGPEEAIARSCNVSAASWALRVGYEEFIPFIQDLGLLERPNLGLPREAGGLFSYDDYARRLQLATLGFGQSINVPPVRLASAFAMLANDGKAVQPRLVRRIGSEEVKVPSGPPVLHPTSAHAVLRFMRAVMESEHGTGKGLAIPGYTLGGKTGTAQKRNPKTGKMDGGYVANFVGFVPAEKPEAVILVMVDNPKAGRYYGSQVAGPVFIDVAKATIQALQIPPTVQEKTKLQPPAQPSASAPTSPASDETLALQVDVSVTRLPDWEKKPVVTTAPSVKPGVSTDVRPNRERGGKPPERATENRVVAMRPTAEKERAVSKPRTEPPAKVAKSERHVVAMRTPKSIKPSTSTAQPLAKSEPKPDRRATPGKTSSKPATKAKPLVRKEASAPKSSAKRPPVKKRSEGKKPESKRVRKPAARAGKTKPMATKPTVRKSTPTKPARSNRNEAHRDR